MDLIDRQAAIDEGMSYINGDCFCDKEDFAKYIEFIEQLPPAQPTVSKIEKVGDTISRQAAIRWVKIECNPYGKPTLDFESGKKVIEHLLQMPSAQSEIIRCKDCRKHNKKVGFDENFHTVWKEDACPLASWRGKAQGHEFDYQFCAFAERREK